MRIKITKIPKDILGRISAKNVKLMVGIELQTIELDDAKIAIVSMANVITCFSEKHYIAARDEFAELATKKNQLVLLPDEYNVI